MSRKQNLFIGSSLLALIIACGVGQNVVEEAADQEQDECTRKEMREVLEGRK